MKDFLPIKPSSNYEKWLRTAQVPSANERAELLAQPADGDTMPCGSAQAGTNEPQHAGGGLGTSIRTILLAVEFGYVQCEKGNNLQEALMLAEKVWTK